MNPAPNSLRDLPLPVAVIRESALSHNIQSMADWTRRHGFQLAPHGKTTMCPAIFRRQLAAGAWGITAATSQQALVCLDTGARRVLIANQLVVPANIRQLRDAFDHLPERECYSIVDSAESLAVLERHWSGAAVPMRVLIEFGRDGWRTGARSFDAAWSLYQQLQRCGPSLRFAGIEGFEGSAANEADARAFVLSMIDAARRFPAQPDPLVFSVGGSAYLGVLAETLRELPAGWVPVLRSGCYVTHDHGIYEQRQLASDGQDVPRFEAALELWAAVQSKPEPGVAILTFGKRNASYDLGLPRPLDLPGASIVSLNDQHAFLRYAEGISLNIGDVVRLGISHPCTTFDKWRRILLVDDDYKVIETLETVF
jgi:D-serine dehydratase